MTKERTMSLMLLGTSSSVGKTVLTAGLCRLFRDEGYRVYPFKSQNMSRYPYLAPDGGRYSFAQAMQAEAAGVLPRADMNPIWLNPCSDTGSEVWVLGELWQKLPASRYYRVKSELWPTVRSAYERLSEEADLILVEGAGSPAEINLQQDDFVNLGLAKRLNIPCLLIGDIDRGGVFASLYGTLALAGKGQKELYKGLLINKFRGDLSLLEPGLRQLESLCSLPVLGTIPMTSFRLPEEDSLSLSEKGETAVQATDREKREEAYDLLAEHLRKHVNLDLLKKIIEDGV